MTPTLVVRHDRLGSSSASLAGAPSLRDGPIYDTRPEPSIWGDCSGCDILHSVRVVGAGEVARGQPRAWGDGLHPPYPLKGRLADSRIPFTFSDRRRYHDAVKYFLCSAIDLTGHRG